MTTMVNGKYKITTLGGGTGSSTLLRGLKKIPDLDLAAIVAMSDDGGSTGRLRDELGVLPPGDVRQCLVALSEAEDRWRKLFNYRISEGNLQGHTTGNIVLSALEKMTGSFEEAIDAAKEILQVRGDVIPVTLNNVRLCAETDDGTIIQGEHIIDLRETPLKRVYLQPEATANIRAIERILCSDVVIICPGDLYTSILPNLIVPGIVQNIQGAKAKKIYVCNLMSQTNHTDNFNPKNFVDLLHRAIATPLIDVVLYNTQRPTSSFLELYAQEGEHSVQAFSHSNPEIEIERVLYIGKDLLSETVVEPVIGDPLPRSFIRHHPQKTAKALYEIITQLVPRRP